MSITIPAILLLILLAAKSQGQSMSLQHGLGPGAVPRRNTGGGGGAQWIAERRAALQRLGVPQWAHRAIIAHWARETGFGRAEWNWNPGNIRALGWSGPRVWLTGRDGTLDYRAYHDLDSGVRDYWRLLQSSRYRRALELLRAGDAVGWYDAILRAGYSRWSPAAVDEFRRILARIP